MKYPSQLLNQSSYYDKLITESEIFESVHYEYKDGAICLRVYQGGKLRRITGSVEDMRKLGEELCAVAEVWEGVSLCGTR